MPLQPVATKPKARGLTKVALDVLDAKAVDEEATSATEARACCGISVSLHHVTSGLHAHTLIARLCAWPATGQNKASCVQI